MFDLEPQENIGIIHFHKQQKKNNSTSSKNLAGILRKQP
jgi:hypothetical protein